MIVKQCPGCATRFEFADELDGKRVRCKSCGDIFRVDRTASKARDDEDDRPRPTRRREEDDDERPAVKARHREKDEEDDRPRSRARGRDEKDDEQPSRTRRPVLEDDDDDRPRGRRRDDDSDDRPPRRGRDDDDDEDAPRRKKKIHPLMILGPILGLIAVVGVILAFTLGGKKKGGSLDVAGDLVKAPTKSCPLEVAEKEASSLVLPDSGNTFGLLRQTSQDAFRKSWVLDTYDMAAGRRTGRLDLPGVQDPKGFSFSPDGKKLLITEGKGFGPGWDLSLSVWSISERKAINKDKWVPFPEVRGGGDAASLHKAEFIGNDRILTLGTTRAFYIYQLPGFEPSQVVLRATGDKLGQRTPQFGQDMPKLQWQTAFTADRRRMAVWCGDSFAIVDTVEGLEQMRTPSVLAMAKELWPRSPRPDFFLRTGPMAFSPDGSVLATVISNGVGFSEEHILCLWDAKEPKEPTKYQIPTNQFNESHSIFWWGSRYVVTSGGRSHGADVEGMLIDVRTGLAKRQLMGPEFRKYGFGRDGRLWYAASEGRDEPATMHVVDPPDADTLSEPDDYEQIRELREEFFLRRLWLEPQGVLRKPTRLNPPLQQRLIRRP